MLLRFLPLLSLFRCERYIFGASKVDVGMPAARGTRVSPSLVDVFLAIGCCFPPFFSPSLSSVPAVGPCRLLRISCPLGFRLQLARTVLFASVVCSDALSWLPWLLRRLCAVVEGEEGRDVDVFMREGCRRPDRRERRRKKNG